MRVFSSIGYRLRPFPAVGVRERSASSVNLSLSLGPNYRPNRGLRRYGLRAEEGQGTICPACIWATSSAPRPGFMTVRRSSDAPPSCDRKATSTT